MAAKRVDIVSCKLVKECAAISYAQRRINAPEDAVGLVRDFLEDADRETIILICLNRKGEPTALHTVSIGTLSSSLVHPREVFKAAILSNSASIILVHNHPSGDPSPSQEDIDISHRIKSAGELLGIELLDHLIIGCQRHCSLKQSGQL